MSFRDDGDAARARADALARELDERDAEIEALRAQLEQKDEALREAKEDASPIVEAAERAQHALEALKRKGNETAKRAREEPETAPSDHEERERERRRLSSVSVWGELDLATVAVIGLAPTLITTLLLALHLLSTMRWAGYALVVPACAGLLALAMHYYGRDWARRQWRLEQKWAKARPYRLLGYPESLEKQPASTRSLPFLHLNDGEHRLLELELDFAGGVIPADLSDIMSGFDELLSTTSPFRESAIEEMEQRMRGEPAGKETKPNVFYRESPVTTARSKSGSTRVVDHNRAVRAFMRRLDREVLEPLHARHGLTQVELRLR